jgi:hypothetical protein
MQSAQLLTTCYNAFVATVSMQVLPPLLGCVPHGFALLTTVVVASQSKGAAACTGSISYEYVDLWSRRTTWGGLEPPVFNDSVVIPAGTTVLLDVSPPRLYMLLIEV